MVQRKPFAGGHREFIDALLSGAIRAERLTGTPGTLEYDDPEEPDVVAVGGIYQTMSAVNPGAAVVAGGLGYGIWLRIADGRVLIGTTTTANVESGAATATPTGTVSAPTFTGTSANTSLVSAGTPTGPCSAPPFVGAQREIATSLTDLTAAIRERFRQEDDVRMAVRALAAKLDDLMEEVRKRP